MPTIAICGEKYSSNLGDGVIADCLEWLIGQARPDVTVKVLDMSRKTEFDRRGAPPGGGVGRARSPVHALVPGFLKRSIREAQWKRAAGPLLEHHAAEVLRGCDALIVGGGQLLMDNNLRFPMKIRSVASAAHAAGIQRVACFGVGVGETWSARAKDILIEALEQPPLSTLTVRDESSARTIAAEFPALADRTDVAGDPALYSAEAYGCAAGPAEGGAVGLGVLSLGVLSRTVDHPDSSDKPAVVAFWLGVIDALDAAGMSAELFSNGDEADQALAEEVARANRDRNGPEVGLAPRPTDPASLVRRISGYSGLIAYRLHSNIIGYALGIPGVLLTWDKKVRHFAELTGRPELALPGLGVDPGEVVQKTLDAMERGLDAEVQSSIQDRVRAALHRTLDLLLEDRPVSPPSRV